MKNLRSRFNRFCFQNRDKGIPNLMLYIVLGNALVYLFTMTSGNLVVYDALCFNRELILKGQVWRLFSYVFTSFSVTSNLLLVAVSYLCYFSLGKAIEYSWGTFRFNLYYLSGVLMMDLFAMIFGGILIPSGEYYYNFSSIYMDMGYYLNLSLFLGYATLHPDAQFLLFFIIPVKAWIFGLLDLALTLYEVFSLSFPLFCFPHNLFPLIAILNYLLFFGKDVLNLIPLSWRMRAKSRKNPAKPKVIRFPGAQAATSETANEPYTHRCTVCGRTDVSNPELEFRYCSRCNGYHCYCSDHISNHTHME